MHHAKLGHFESSVRKLSWWILSMHYCKIPFHYHDPKPQWLCLRIIRQLPDGFTRVSGRKVQDYLLVDFMSSATIVFKRERVDHVVLTNSLSKLSARKTASNRLSRRTCKISYNIDKAYRLQYNISVVQVSRGLISCASRLSPFSLCSQVSPHVRDRQRAKGLLQILYLSRNPLPRLQWQL